MKLTLLSINSKYIHSSLAMWYLTAACDKYCTVTPLEHSINEPRLKILQSVCESEPDVFAICCYIWNIDMVLDLCREVKIIRPELRIVLGGPEVSFRAEEIMENNPEIEAIFLGEGEESLPSYLQGELPHGIVYRRDGCIIKNGDYQCVADLDSIPSPYTDKMLASLKGKLAYFESSRGCPFSCSYCLSSATRGVRTFSMDRVREDLLKLVSAKPETIKFVDRTFNADKARAKEIIKFLLSLGCDTTFHFEVGADLFDDELLSLLKSAPSGKFQIEAGIQSTNERTLKTVCRATDTKKALAVLNEITSWGNVHVHGDLICGLPHEDLNSFKKSFNALFTVRPHTLQVGFLKLLHGSKLRREFEGEFSPFPPYQVLKTPHINADELFFLQDFENSVDLFYNSGRFNCTINYLSTVFPSAFDLFAALSEKLRGKSAFSPDNLFLILSNLEVADKKRLNSALCFDYFSSFKSRYLPEFLNEPKDLFYLVENGEISSLSQVPVKVLAKAVAIKEFPYDMEDFSLAEGASAYIFSRKNRSPVTGRFKTEKL